MNRKLLTCCLVLLVMALFAGCGSAEDREAQTAYNSGDYQRVIEIYQDAETPEGEEPALLRSAEAHLAFEKGEYDQVLALLDEEPSGEELQALQTEAKARLACEAGDYEEVIALLGESEDADTRALYQELLSTMLDQAMTDRNAEAVTALLDILPDSADMVYKKVTEACEGLDYSAFQLMDGLCAALPDGDLKHDMAAYKDSHSMNRSKAFMNGKWAWYETEAIKEPTVIEVFMRTDDSSVAVLREIGERLQDFGYGIGDVYWNNIDFLTDTEFKMYHMTRYEGGAIAGVEATASVDFENDCIQTHVTGANSPDRTWVRYTPPATDTAAEAEQPAS